MAQYGHVRANFGKLPFMYRPVAEVEDTITAADTGSVNEEVVMESSEVPDCQSPMYVLHRIVDIVDAGPQN